MPMDRTTQTRKAALLNKLHHGPKILVLANAWDAISARIVEEIGFPAVATTSAGVAATLGYPDGQRVSRDEMLQVVARVTLTATHSHPVQLGPSALRLTGSSLSIGISPTSSG